MAQREYAIAAIPADGIGIEVIDETIKLLDALQRRFTDVGFRIEKFDWGSDYYKAHGVMMPADGLDTLRPFDAILFGAVGAPDVPDHVTLWGLRLAICQGFDQYANVRPSRVLPGIPVEFSVLGEVLGVPEKDIRIIDEPPGGFHYLEPRISGRREDQYTEEYDRCVSEP